MNPADIPATDRLLLLAYVATESASIAVALRACGGEDWDYFAANRQAHLAADVWATEAGLDEPRYGPARLLACREFLTLHIEELAALADRVGL